MSINREQALEMEKRTWAYLDTLTDDDKADVELSYREFDAVTLCELYKSNREFLETMGDRWVKYQ